MQSIVSSKGGLRTNAPRKFSISLTESIPPYSFRALLLVVGSIAVATGARELFGQLGADLKFATYFPAVLIVALLAGPPAAVMTIIGSMLTVWWAFVPPFHSFVPLDTTQQINMLLFIFSCALIVGLSHSYRRLYMRLAARERERELILRELEHRGRNTYAIIEAIIRKTMEDDPARAETIAGRVRAVKFANDLINRADNHTILFRSLLDFEFAPYGRERFEIEGEDIVLNADTARSLALVIHELVTNAAKYGALSLAHGRVLLSWRMDGETVALRWKEEGGPSVTKPVKHNFGTKIVTETLKSLSGGIVATFAEAGFQCEIRFRLPADDSV